MMRIVWVERGRWWGRGYEVILGDLKGNGSIGETDGY
jgi:hypothetical protein